MASVATTNIICIVCVQRCFCYHQSAVDDIAFVLLHILKKHLWANIMCETASVAEFNLHVSICKVFNALHRD